MEGKAHHTKLTNAPNSALGRAVRSDEDVFQTRPWERTDASSWQYRDANLDHPRIAPLTAFIRDLRRETGKEVSWIDPFCGGKEAPILTVFLRPGPRGAMNSSYLSLANMDATAQNTVEVIMRSGITYRDLVFWNAIPWPGPREEKITSEMRDRGALMFQRMIPLLSNLSAVIFVGGEAQRLRFHVKLPAGVRSLSCAHPGPFVWNQHRYRPLKEGIFQAFAAAAQAASQPSS